MVGQPRGFPSSSRAARRCRARASACASGPGNWTIPVSPSAIALGLTGIVQFPGPLAHAEARALQRRAALLLLGKPRGCPTMVPGKIYEYFEAGRRVAAQIGRASCREREA